MSEPEQAHIHWLSAQLGGTVVLAVQSDLHAQYVHVIHSAEPLPFRVPLGPGAVVTNTGFRAPQYHSGEPYSNAPWTADVSATDITFSTTPTALKRPRTSA